jgi:hypothetical protein
MSLSLLGGMFISTYSKFQFHLLFPISLLRVFKPFTVFFLGHNMCQFLLIEVLVPRKNSSSVAQNKETVSASIGYDSGCASIFI